MAHTPRKLPVVPVTAAPALSIKRALSIRSLKDLVIARFPEDHPLRAVILVERDVLTPVEFVAKMEVWTVLLNRHA